MKTLKYSEILARNRALKSGLSGKPYRIALLSNIVVSQLGELLEFALRTEGINAEVVCGDYDNIVQDSARMRGVDAAVVFWEAGNLVDGLHARIDIMDAADIAALRERALGEVRLALENLRAIPLVLFNRFSAALFCADDLRERPLERLCRELDAGLDAANAPNLVLVNIDRVIAKTGLGGAADFRQFQSSKALYSIDFFKAYAEHVAPAFRSATGRTRKVLVLDCDNTLWGGILGEDGESGIRMDDGSRAGKVYREVQHILKGMRNDGVLLALCSKNNSEDVDRVLREHPDMVLRGEDFVARKINWQDKAANLEALAEELNLGLDSFVFVDDSGFELGLIREALPQVAVVQVPEQLPEYPGIMRRARQWFFNLSASREDARKTEMYLEEGERRRAAARFSSVEDYLRSLGLRIVVSWNDEVPVERAAQLTQKTNQFNLTTRRYTEAEIRGFLGGGRHLVAAVDVADRYGAYGVTGLAIVECGRREARLDTFLMSCRVLGRNVERAFFDQLVAALRGRGIERMEARYLRTPKNAQVSSLLETFGFSVTNHAESNKSYLIALDEYRANQIDYIEVTANAC